jgi:hypothetical protein
VVWNAHSVAIMCARRNENCNPTVPGSRNSTGIRRLTVLTATVPKMDATTAVFRRALVRDESPRQLVSRIETRQHLVCHSHDFHLPGGLLVAFEGVFAPAHPSRSGTVRRRQASKPSIDNAASDVCQRLCVVARASENSQLRSRRKTRAGRVESGHPTCWCDDSRRRVDDSLQRSAGVARSVRRVGRNPDFQRPAPGRWCEICR